ncbi:cytochrome P450 [Streptomyces sp. NPDC005955]|uniref:cytochrome P450 n=1 Tax=Streptomyces sp. NPDC005955 TaxID=3364738 RepID=UPI0036A6257F
MTYRPSDTAPTASPAGSAHPSPPPGRPAEHPVRDWAVDDLPALTFDPLLSDVLHGEGVARITLPFAGDRHEAWLVTRYEDVKFVTSDPRFSRTALTETTVTGMSGHRVASTAGLNYADPPYHSRLRKSVQKAFTGQAMKRLRPLAQETCDTFLDRMEEHGSPADLMEHLHAPVPLAVVCDLLGVPRDDRDGLVGWGDVILSMTTPKAGNEAKARVTAFIVELLHARRDQPSDDLAGALAEAMGAGDITEAEAVSLATAILVSGAHAVRYNSANMVFVLLTRPELMARLRAHPQDLPQAVDELIRHIPHRNGVGLPRIATEDVEVGGASIRAGEAVYASYLAANRDPEVFDDPDTVDFDRQGTAHLSFGHGPHHCMGAMLARMESEVMVSTLLSRFPDLRLAVAPEDVPFQSKGFIRGPRVLPVAW